MRSGQVNKETLFSFAALVIKLVLGASFIYASFHKIENPSEFAKILYGYDLFPTSMINILAILVPFIELTTGFSLIMGLFPKSAVIIMNAMMVVFILIIGFNLLRGHEFDCGCFAFASQNHTVDNIISLIRDVVYLAGGIFLMKHLKQPPIRRRSKGLI